MKKNKTLQDYVTGTQSGNSVFQKVNTVPMEKKGKVNPKPKPVKTMRGKRKSAMC